MTMKQRIYSYARSSYAWAKGHKPVLWAGAIVAAVIVVIILAVLLPRPGTEGPGATPTPSATATPSGNATVTVTAAGTTTPGGTATAGATKTSGGTPSGTAIATATAAPAEGEVSIYFRDAEIEVGAGCQEFTTDILITPPIDYFYGCQFRLAWDATLFYLQPEGYMLDGSQVDMRGRICTTEACTGPFYKWSEPVTVNPTGSQHCPLEYHRNMFWTDWYEVTHAMGCANFVSTWGLTGGGYGYNVREHTEGTNENRLIRLHWITSGSCADPAFSYGKTANTGTTEIVFYPVGALDGGQGLMCACTDGSRVPPEYDLEDVYTLHWVGASVTVK